MTSRPLGAVCAMMFFTASAHCASLSFDFDSGPGPNFAIVNTGDLWAIDTDGPDLRISKPTDDGTVNPTGFIAGGIQSNFTVTGDFTITVDFFLYDLPPVSLPRLLPFPLPRLFNGFNESLLSLSFDGGQVFNVLRFEDHKGSFIEAFAAPPDTALGVMTSTLISGRYRISRTGSVITGHFAPSGSSVFTPLGSVSGWSDPVQVALLGAQGSRNLDRPTTSLDIGFDNLTISADGIVGLVPIDIDIEKLTNGNQADGADDLDVPRIALGETVVWTYQVTNTGGVDISEAEIQVTDSQPGVTPMLDTASDTGGDLLLSPSETWIYTATAQALDLSVPPEDVTVVAGCGDGRNTYKNIGRVDITGTGLFDEDASHYCNSIIPAATPVASVSPSSRSVQVGNAATAFATIINSGSITATDCGIAPLTSVGADFSYQTTDADNVPTGTKNTPVDIAPSGTQNYAFAFTPTASFGPVDIQLAFDCANTDPAPIAVGLNTLLLVADSNPVPDIVALSATPTGDGIVNLASTGAFAVATVNVGSTDTITVSADTGSASLPVTIALCETNRATGACINPMESTTGPLTTSIAAGATPTFAFFVTSTGTVPFDPANNRIFVRFKDGGGVTRGSTSVAVRTQ